MTLRKAPFVEGVFYLVRNAKMTLLKSIRVYPNFDMTMIKKAVSRDMAAFFMTSRTYEAVAVLQDWKQNRKFRF